MWPSRGWCVAVMLVVGCTRTPPTPPQDPGGGELRPTGGEPPPEVRPQIPSDLPVAATAAGLDHPYPTHPAGEPAASPAPVKGCPKLRWQVVADSPLPPGPIAGRGNQVVAHDGRLLRLSHDVEGVEGGHLYDVRTGSWQLISQTDAPDYIEDPVRSSPAYQPAGRGVHVLWSREGISVASYYDPVDDRWSSRPITWPLSSEARFHPTPTGFIAIEPDDLTRVLHFNAPSLTWTLIDASRGAPPVARAGVALTDAHVVAWNGTDVGHVFELATGRWRAMSRANMPSARWAMFAGANAGRVVFWGGVRHGGSFFNSADRLLDGGVYDPVHDRWAGARSAAPGVAAGAPPAEALSPLGPRFFLPQLEPTTGAGLLHLLDTRTGAWRALRVPMATGAVFGLGANHAIVIELPGAAVVDLETGKVCRPALDELPLLRGAGPTTSVLASSLGASLLMWGRLDFACPSCPPRAPCALCQPPTQPDRIDGVLLTIAP